MIWCVQVVPRTRCVTDRVSASGFTGRLARVRRASWHDVVRKRRYLQAITPCVPGSLVQQHMAGVVGGCSTIMRWMIETSLRLRLVVLTLAVAVMALGVWQIS